MTDTKTDSKKPCPVCAGRGWVPFATDEVKCSNCDGTGKV